MPFNLRVLSLQCTHSQEILHFGRTPFWALVNVYVCNCARICMCVFSVCMRVTMKLPDQMCRSLGCAEWRVAPSLTLQTLNNAHRFLQLMSSLYRAHTVRALLTVSIRASISGEQIFLWVCWHQTKDLIQNANQHRVPELVPVCSCHKLESDSFSGSGWSTFKSAGFFFFFVAVNFPSDTWAL